jgi:serine/threonine protein kinase
MEKDQGLFGSEGYILGKRLAADSWGELYEAVYKPLAAEVLFRRLPEAVAADRAAWELASAEIQAWARLDHRGILQVLDWGISPGEDAPEAYLVTEMPGGRILMSILEEPGSRLDRPPGWADSVFAGLLSSVEAARRWGVLHLGLCPECIWVSAAGEVTVSDFGLWYVTSRFLPAAAGATLFSRPSRRVEARRARRPTSIRSECCTSLSGAGVTLSSRRPRAHSPRSSASTGRR